MFAILDLWVGLVHELCHLYELLFVQDDEPVYIKTDLVP